jgi:hypothetical protein
MPIDKVKWIEETSQYQSENHNLLTYTLNLCILM